ncbi:MAG: hypothetical protein LQ338_008148 [Usnochroma carphineum]|nr:MAG: hypothetical protein LQ338_008148 [Usnochroma carphineum]
MKRKAEDNLDERLVKKKAAVEANGSTRFREGLLQQADDYHKQYVASEPYKHGVIQDLLEPQLLRNVRAEIHENLSFTPKETDIYRIHQSGDLANLDGLDDSSLKLLPSLLALRDALYSPSFRNFLSTVTGAGPLSGRKTDMAINVYIPGCHLLCHDDVIGSRRVSYILYLTDPDQPWKPEWGGALRLYPTVVHKREDGKEVKVPSPDHSVSIPPAFNQLSFFAVQPRASFHDVEEVYAQNSGSYDEGDGSRFRMAISGWYHIPQEGENGYVEGLEESLAEGSSLQQLQGTGDQYDRPQPHMHTFKDVYHDKQEFTEPMLSEDDFEFLLKYIAPTYLTPDTLESISNSFSDECSICLGKFLSRKFSSSLKDFISQQEAKDLPSAAQVIESETAWRVARPPHKHRFLYQQASEAKDDADLKDSPIQDLLRNLLPSEAFRKWLQLATGVTLSSYNLCARRFRRGKDYTLATGYTGDESQLEIILAITPTRGWGGDDELADDDKTTEKPDTAKDNDATNTPSKDNDSEEPAVGGYVAYMASDDADHESNDGDGHSSDGVEVPPDLSTGARASRSSAPKTRSNKADPAVYKAATADGDEDDGVLFSMPACWNSLGIVLCDKGVMRFVKYVSQQAPGDRWDVVGEFGVVPDEEEDEEEGECGVGDESATQRSLGADQIIEHEESETEIESSINDDDDDDSV